MIFAAAVVMNCSIHLRHNFHQFPNISVFWKIRLFSDTFRISIKKPALRIVEMAWIRSVFCVLVLFVAVFAEVRENSKPPKSPSGTTTPPPPADPPKTESKTEIDDMEVKNVWLAFDTIYMCVGGAALFFFPEPMIDYQVSIIDDGYFYWISVLLDGCFVGYESATFGGCFGRQRCLRSRARPPRCYF